MNDIFTYTGYTCMCILYEHIYALHNQTPCTQRTHSSICVLVRKCV